MHIQSCRSAVSVPPSPSSQQVQRLQSRNAPHSPLALKHREISTFRVPFCRGSRPLGSRPLGSRPQAILISQGRTPHVRNDTHHPSRWRPPSAAHHTARLIVPTFRRRLQCILGLGLALRSQIRNPFTPENTTNINERSGSSRGLPRRSNKLRWGWYRIGRFSPGERRAR